MNILLTSPTKLELAGTLDHIESIAENKSYLEYRINGHSIYPLVTGVGAMNTAFALARFPRINGIQLAIHCGIAGTYDIDDVPIGEVVEVVRSRFADLGSENSDGSLLDVFELGLSDPNVFPYTDGWIENKDRPYHSDLKEVSDLTVNKVNGTPLSIALVKEKYDAHIESMECAGFLYACRMIDIKAMCIRSISNKVEARNRDSWQIPMAVEKLNKSVIKLIHVLTRERYV
ncbi:MAG: futalosine hydrolase [Saprospiraceae bacterium]|nr:futalosine hydrolase [Saprospiraceae bacterium]